MTGCQSKPIKIYVVPEIPDYLFERVEFEAKDVITFRDLIEHNIVLNGALQQCEADKTAVKKILDAFDTPED